MHAKETNVHSVYFLKCKKCFGSVREALNHLAWVYKPVRNTQVQTKLQTKRCYVVITVVISCIVCCQSSVGEQAKQESYKVHFHCIYILPEVEDHHNRCPRPIRSWGILVVEEFKFKTLKFSWKLLLDVIIIIVLLDCFGCICWCVPWMCVAKSMTNFPMEKTQYILAISPVI